MANVADKVSEMIRDTVEQQGVSLWDVRFIKEGASYYLRIYIDKADGVSIDDCTNVSHAIDPILDAADPIECSYYLEVCSPGLERELIRDEHFAVSTGKKIHLRLFKAQNGTKELEGMLIAFDNGIVRLETSNGEIAVARTDIAKASLAESFGG